MAISDAQIGDIVASAYETPMLEQREVMSLEYEIEGEVIDFTFWSTDQKRIAEFRVPRAVWDDFKAFGDSTLAKFDEAKAV